MRVPTDHFPRLLPLVLLGLALGGCTFSRIVANDHVRRLETSFIRIGETDRQTVIHRLGPPPALVGDRRRVNAYSPERLRYVCSETKRARLDLGGGYIGGIGFTLAWEDEQPICEWVIDFDRRGIVTRVAKTERGTLWKPFQSEASRSRLVYRERR
ncbi:MAG: hypothetical protein SPK06_02300 [Kiritimatiellia bacterium]|nr:hypothetical protein [Kiritimatiellia bacterium]